MMRRGRLFAVKLVLGIVVILPVFLLAAQNISAANTIGGTVFDKKGNPLNSIDVELLDEYYRLLQRIQTDSTGRYQFTGLNNGNYTVRVMAFRYDLEEQSYYLEIFAISARPGDPGSTFINQDFYLQPKRGGLREAELSVVFAQEIPKDAEKSYKKAIDSLDSRRTDEGVRELRESVRLFPKYYNALYRLGQELIQNKQYGEAVQIFIRAAEVNPKSATSLYYIGYSLYNLGKDYDKAALKALGEAYKLAPASVQILWLLGKVERDMGKYEEAEKHLLQAKKLSVSKVPEIHKELYNLYAVNLKKYSEAADELELYIKTSKLKDGSEKKLKEEVNKLRAKAKTQAAS